MLIDDQKRDKTQVVYIATSQNYARQNRFKIGGVESTDKLASRFSTYNSRSAVVPPPSEVIYASITTLAKNGRATNTTLEAGSTSDFVTMLREYIANLDESVTFITKKQVFDDLRVTKDRREKTSVVKAVFEEMRPDVNLKSKSCYHGFR